MDLLALSRSIDPFNADTPAKRAQAEWFASLFERYKFPVGVHLRRMHYVLVSQKKPPLLPDSEKAGRKAQPYVNTEQCWGWLQEYSTFARHLGLVAADAFTDHRNPDPYIVLNYGDPQEPFCVLDEVPSWTLPKVRTDLADQVSFLLPEPVVYGYGYDNTAHPYHCEVWIEKSTMNDVLIPLCRDLGVNLVVSIGFQSITAAVKLLKRAALAGKPIRVFWIADFDPAGIAMAAAVARQVEFYLRCYAPDADIKITILALTREQVRRYNLPRVPIKESDSRKANFEDRHGEGAVELDALEALHPGTLAQMVRDAVAPYRDENLEARLAETGEEAEDQARAEWEEATAPVREELEQIEEEAREICRRYEDRLAEIDAELQAELQPLAARLAQARQGWLEAAADFNPDLPPRPEGDVDVTDEDEEGWLFDSNRDYEEQLEAYKRNKNGG
jgi:hypothetical protein